MTTNSKNLAFMLAGLIAIISVGVFSATNTVEASQEDASGMMGHITLVLKDSDGYITDYVQTDNLVTDEGRDCITENTFAASSVCGSGFFTFVGLGTGSGQGAGTGILADDLESGCARQDAATGGGADITTSAGSTTETITITIEVGGESSGADLANAACKANISEAGLFNDVGVAGGEMFAYQSFTPITIGASDTLTVTWTITIVGS